VIRLSLAVVVGLLIVPAALASERHPTLGELEGEVMCPVCGTTLDQSDSPAAQQIDRLIVSRIAAGDTKNEIKNRLVAEYGEAILAAPRRRGLGLLAWWLPLGGIVVAAAAPRFLQRMKFLRFESGFTGGFRRTGRLSFFRYGQRAAHDLIDARLGDLAIAVLASRVTDAHHERAFVRDS